MTDISDIITSTLLIIDSNNINIDRFIDLLRNEDKRRNREKIDKEKEKKKEKEKEKEEMNKGKEKDNKKNKKDNKNLKYDVNSDVKFGVNEKNIINYAEVKKEMKSEINTDKKLDVIKKDNKTEAKDNKSDVNKNNKSEVFKENKKDNNDKDLVKINQIKDEVEPTKVEKKDIATQAEKKVEIAKKINNKNLKSDKLDLKKDATILVEKIKNNESTKIDKKDNPLKVEIKAEHTQNKLNEINENKEPSKLEKKNAVPKVEKKVEKVESKQIKSNEINEVKVKDESKNLENIDTKALSPRLKIADLKALIEAVETPDTFYSYIMVRCNKFNFLDLKKELNAIVDIDANLGDDKYKKMFYSSIEVLFKLTKLSKDQFDEWDYASAAYLLSTIIYHCHHVSPVNKFNTEKGYRYFVDYSKAPFFAESRINLISIALSFELDLSVVKARLNQDPISPIDKPHPNARMVSDCFSDKDLESAWAKYNSIYSTTKFHSHLTDIFNSFVLKKNALSFAKNLDSLTQEFLVKILICIEEATMNKLKPLVPIKEFKEVWMKIHDKSFIDSAIEYKCDKNLLFKDFSDSGIIKSLNGKILRTSEVQEVLVGKLKNMNVDKLKELFNTK